MRTPSGEVDLKKLVYAEDAETKQQVWIEMTAIGVSSYLGSEKSENATGHRNVIPYKSIQFEGRASYSPGFKLVSEGITYEPPEKMVVALEVASTQTDSLGEASFIEVLTLPASSIYDEESLIVTLPTTNDFISDLWAAMAIPGSEFQISVAIPATYWERTRVEACFVEIETNDEDDDPIGPENSFQVTYFIIEIKHRATITDPYGASPEPGPR